MVQVSMEEASAHFESLLSTVLRGEEVEITRGDHAIARLVPVSEEQPRPRFGSAKGLFTVPDDFDDPLPDFDEYMR